MGGNQEVKSVDLSVIIVNYNTLEVLKACLDSLRKSDDKDYTKEIIVVDNNSTDGSVKEISNFKFQISNFKLIENKENLGFSKANNIAVKEAKGRYLLFLNPDTVVEKNTLSHVVSFMDSHKDAGVLTCKVRLMNGGLDDGSHRGFPTPWNSFCHFSGISRVFPKSKFFNGYHMGWCQMDKVHAIDACVGAFMMVRREAGEQIGWWDEDYFFYGEDLEFCYQIKETGWKTYYVPEVFITHYKGIAGGIKKHSQKVSTASRETKLLATKARFDAMRIFYKKHYVKKYPKFVTDIVLFGINLKQKKVERSL